MNAGAHGGLDGRRRAIDRGLPARATARRGTIAGGGGRVRLPALGASRGRGRRDGATVDARARRPGRDPRRDGRGPRLAPAHPAARRAELRQRLQEPARRPRRRADRGGGAERGTGRRRRRSRPSTRTSSWPIPGARATTSWTLIELVQDGVEARRGRPARARGAAGRGVRRMQPDGAAGPADVGDRRPSPRSVLGRALGDVAVLSVDPGVAATSGYRPTPRSEDGGDRGRGRRSGRRGRRWPRPSCRAAARRRAPRLDAVVDRRGLRARDRGVGPTYTPLFRASVGVEGASHLSARSARGSPGSSLARTCCASMSAADAGWSASWIAGRRVTRSLPSTVDDRVAERAVAVATTEWPPTVAATDDRVARPHGARRRGVRLGSGPERAAASSTGGASRCGGRGAARCRRRRARVVGRGRRARSRSTLAGGRPRVIRRGRAARCQGDRSRAILAWAAGALTPCVDRRHRPGAPSATRRGASRTSPAGASRGLDRCTSRMPSTRGERLSLTDLGFPSSFAVLYVYVDITITVHLTVRL